MRKQDKPFGYCDSVAEAAVKGIAIALVILAVIVAVVVTVL